MRCTAASEAVIRESADLIYNLVVLWVASGVHPQEVWIEMERRERLLGIAEKLPSRRLSNRRGARWLRSSTGAPASGIDRTRPFTARSIGA